MWVRIPLQTQSFESCVCYVLCKLQPLRQLITLSEESYSVCMSNCDLDTSTVRQPEPKLGCCGTRRICMMYDNQLYLIVRLSTWVGVVTLLTSMWVMLGSNSVVLTIQRFFLIYLSPSKCLLRYYFKIYHDHILIPSFPCIIHSHPIILNLVILS